MEPDILKAVKLLVRDCMDKAKAESTITIYAGPLPTNINNVNLEACKPLAILEYNAGEGFSGPVIESFEIRKNTLWAYIGTPTFNCIVPVTNTHEPNALVINAGCCMTAADVQVRSLNIHFNL